MTKADKIKKQYEGNRELIKAWTGLTDEDLAVLKYESGVQYAQDNLGNPDFVTIVLKSANYWAWWKNQWAKRDEEFIDSIKITPNGERFILVDVTPPSRTNGFQLRGKCSIQVALTLTTELTRRKYLEYHSPNNLQNYPHKSILEESYKLMIHEYVKNIQK